MSRGHDAGFTLIESLVALAVLAIGSVSLLVASQAYVRRVAGLEDRALAQMAAENELTALQLGSPPAAEPVVLLGHRYGLQTRTSPTADPDLQRIEIVVTELDTRERYGGFVGFLAKGDAR